jgi:fructose-1,6-bisphosphatase/inositol monophosphatase family enzyme
MVIDPIDGTFNFRAGLDHWCSPLALEDNNGLLLGAVHQPATAEHGSAGVTYPPRCDVGSRTHVMEAHGHHWYRAGNHRALAQAIELLNAR